MLYYTVSKRQFQIELREDWRYQKFNQKPSYNERNKWDKRQTNNGLQNTTQKTEDRATRTPLKYGVNSGDAEKLTFLVLLVVHVMFFLHDTNIIISKNHIGY